MSEVRTWRFELDEGAAILSLPAKLSKADVEDLTESFALVVRTLVRLVELQNCGDETVKGERDDDEGQSTREVD